MKLFLFGDSHKQLLANAGVELGLDVLHAIWSSFTMARYAMEGRNLVNIECEYKRQFTYLQYGGWAIMLNERAGWKNEEVDDGDMAVYSFGEIDCRVHLCLAQNFSHYKDIVDDMVPRYFKAMEANARDYANLRTLVNCVVPPSEQPPENIKTKITLPHDPTPFTGSNEDRKTVVLYMNSKLKEYCEKYNFIYFDIYDKYTDKNGFIQKERSDGPGGHIVDFSDATQVLKNFVPVSDKAFKQTYKVLFSQATGVATLEIN